MTLVTSYNGSMFIKEADQASQTSDVRQAESHPTALWESSIWPLAKQQVTDHFCCGRLNQESLPEKFCFDDREVLLHNLNLSPSRWSPDISSQTCTHTPVACTGYFTLTILGKSSTCSSLLRSYSYSCSIEMTLDFC